MNFVAKGRFGLARGYAVSPEVQSEVVFFDGGEVRWRKSVRGRVQPWEFQLDVSGAVAWTEGAAGIASTEKSLVIFPDGTELRLDEVALGAPDADGWVALCKPGPDVRGTYCRQETFTAQPGIGVRFFNVRTKEIEPLKFAFSARRTPAIVDGRAVYGLWEGTRMTSLISERPGQAMKIPFEGLYWSPQRAGDWFVNRVSQQDQDVLRVNVRTGTSQKITLVLPSGFSFRREVPTVDVDGNLIAAFDDESRASTTFSSSDLGTTWKALGDALPLEENLGRHIKYVAHGDSVLQWTDDRSYLYVMGPQPKSSRRVLSRSSARVTELGLRPPSQSSTSMATLNSDGRCVAYWDASANGRMNLKAIDLVTDQQWQLISEEEIGIDYSELNPAWSE